MPWTLKFLILPAALLLSSGCTTAGAKSTGILVPLDGGEQRIMNQDIVGRFPGAKLVGQEYFASAIVGRAFRYREVASGIVINQPREVFLKGGRYELHGTRTISHCTYSVQGGIVSIQCPESFLGLNMERIFFRHKGKLFTANAVGPGAAYELIPEN